MKKYVPFVLVAAAAAMGCSAETGETEHTAQAKEALKQFGAPAARITCESQNHKYDSCAVDARGVTGVRLARQLSNAPCIEGTTWGFAHDYIWVNLAAAPNSSFRAMAGATTVAAGATTATIMAAAGAITVVITAAAIVRAAAAWVR